MKTNNKRSGVGAARMAAAQCSAVESTSTASTTVDAKGAQAAEGAIASAASSCCADIAKALQQAQSTIAKRFGISPETATLSASDSDDLDNEELATAEASDDAETSTPDSDSEADDQTKANARTHTNDANDTSAADTLDGATAEGATADSATSASKASASATNTSFSPSGEALLHGESYEDDEAIARLLLETNVYSDNKVGLCDETMELMCKAIGDGDLGKLNWAYRLYESEQRAVLGNDEVRNLKNHAQGLIMLAAMESRKAGVKHKHLVALSERLALAVELLQDVDRITHMCYVIARAFTELVASHKRTQARIEAAQVAYAVTSENEAQELDSGSNPRVITTLGYLNSEDSSAHSYESKSSAAKGKTAGSAQADASAAAPAKKHDASAAQVAVNADSMSVGASSAALDDAAAEDSSGTVAQYDMGTDTQSFLDELNASPDSDDTSAAKDDAKASPKTRRRTKDGVEPDVVVQARAYIEKHLYEDVFVADIGAAVGCTKEHISRLFKRYHKMTLMEYVTAQRIRIAKDMLTSSDAKIKVIAQVLRFSSVAHFCNVFRDMEHATPTQWREEHMTYPNPGARPIPQYFPVDDE